MCGTAVPGRAEWAHLIGRPWLTSIYGCLACGDLPIEASHSCAWMNDGDGDQREQGPCYLQKDTVIQVAFREQSFQHVLVKCLPWVDPYHDSSSSGHSVSHSLWKYFTDLSNVREKDPFPPNFPGFVNVHSYINKTVINWHSGLFFN